MTIAQSKISLAQKLFRTVDKHILKTIELLFENESLELSIADKNILDVQMDEIEKGKAKFYTLSEAKKIIRKNHTK